MRVLGAIQQPQPQQQEYAQRVASDVSGNINEVASTVSSLPKSPSLRQEIGAGLNIGKNATAAVLSPVLQTPPLQKLGQAFGWTGQQIDNVLSKNPTYAKAFESLASLLDKNPEIGDAVSLVNNVGALQGIASSASSLASNTVGALARGSGRTLQTLGEKSTGVGVAMEVPTRQALQAYQASKPTIFERVQGMTNEPGVSKPITEANTAVRLLTPGTEWRLGVSADRVSGQLWNKTIAPALASPTYKVSMDTFFGMLRKKIIGENADLTRRNALLQAYDAFKSDYANVKDVSFAKLQDYKAGWAKFVPERAYQGNPIAGSLNDVRNIAAQQARSIIYDALGPDVRQAYIDYGNLKSIQESGIKSVDQLRTKGVTKQVWEAVMDKAVTPIATIAGKVLYRTGEGLEFIGDMGAKKVSDIFNIGFATPAATSANQSSSPRPPKSTI